MADASVWDQLDSTDAPYHESSMRINHDTEKVIERAVARGRDLERRVADVLGVLDTLERRIPEVSPMSGEIFRVFVEELRPLLKEPTP